MLVLDVSSEEKELLDALLVAALEEDSRAASFFGKDASEDTLAHSEEGTNGLPGETRGMGFAGGENGLPLPSPSLAASPNGLPLRALGAEAPALADPPPFNAESVPAMALETPEPGLSTEANTNKFVSNEPRILAKRGALWGCATFKRSRSRAKVENNVGRESRALCPALASWVSRSFSEAHFSFKPKRAWCCSFIMRFKSASMAGGERCGVGMLGLTACESDGSPFFFLRAGGRRGAGALLLGSRL